MGHKKFTIYDENYYICKALLQNRRFLAEVGKIRNYYEEKGYPIKTGGFSYPFEFQKWYETLSKDVETKHIDNYSMLFRKALKQFINPSNLNDHYHQFMFNLVFFQQKKKAGYTPLLWEAKAVFQIPNPKYIRYLIEEGFYLRLFPHTRLDDIKRDWRKIQEIANRAAKDQPNKFRWDKSRSHEDSDFPLALKIVENYVKEKSKLMLKGWRERSPRGTTLYQKMRVKLAKNYRNVSIKKIKKLLHKYKYLTPLFKEPAYREL